MQGTRCRRAKGRGPHRDQKAGPHARLVCRGGPGSGTWIGAVVVGADRRQGHGSHRTTRVSVRTGRGRCVEGQAYDAGRGCAGPVSLQ